MSGRSAARVGKTVRKKPSVRLWKIENAHQTTMVESLEFSPYKPVRIGAAAYGIDHALRRTYAYSAVGSAMHNS